MAARPKITVKGIPDPVTEARHASERVLLSNRGHAIAALLREAYSGPGAPPSPLTITQATRLTQDADFAARLKELL